MTTFHITKHNSYRITNRCMVVIFAVWQCPANHIFFSPTLSWVGEGREGCWREGGEEGRGGEGCPSLRSPSPGRRKWPCHQPDSPSAAWKTVISSGGEMSLGSASSASPRSLTHAPPCVYLLSLRFLPLTKARVAPLPLTWK